MSEGPEIDSAAVSSLGREPGLCARCRHHRILRSTRSAFLRCGLSDIDSAFPRYPPLPVLACKGFEAEVAVVAEQTPDR